MILSVLSSPALVSGLMVARAKNPVHSVLFPIPVFRDTSGLLLLLGLDFSAMIFPVVHIGAIAVSFLFVVMMFHIQIAETHEEVLRYLPVSGIIGLILWWEMFFILDNETIPLLPTHRNTTSLRYTVHAGKVRSWTNFETLGNLLYTYYSVWFLVPSPILLVAMIGAIVLTMHRTTKVKRQDVFRRNAIDSRRTIMRRTTDPLTPPRRPCLRPGDTRSASSRQIQFNKFIAYFVSILLFVHLKLFLGDPGVEFAKIISQTLSAIENMYLMEGGNGGGFLRPVRLLPIDLNRPPEDLPAADAAPGAQREAEIISAGRKLWLKANETNKSPQELAETATEVVRLETALLREVETVLEEANLPIPQRDRLRALVCFSKSQSVYAPSTLQSMLRDVKNNGLESKVLRKVLDGNGG